MTISQIFFEIQNPTPAYIPQAKAWGLGGKIDKLREEDPELYVEIEREGLIETFGDIPEVHTYTKILLKILQQEPLTDAEIRDFDEAIDHLWPDRKQ